MIRCESQNFKVRDPKKEIMSRKVQGLEKEIMLRNFQKNQKIQIWTKENLGRIQFPKEAQGYLNYLINQKRQVRDLCLENHPLKV